MTTLQITSDPAFGPITYPVTDDALAKLRADFADIRADLDQPNYERAKDARSYCVSLRGQIEDAHAKLKRPVLDYGKRIDSERKRLIGIVTEIETPLRLGIQRVDDEKNRAKREAEQAELDRIETERAEEERAREEATARVKAAEEQLAKERAAFEAEQKAARAKAAEIAAAQQAKLDADKAAVEADRRAVFEATQKAIQAREDAVRADEERVRAAAKAEKDRQEAAERQRVLDAEAEERAEDERRAAEERRPDVEKVQALAAAFRILCERPGFIHAVQLPIVTTPAAQAFMAKVRGYLEELAKRCEAFR